MVYVITAAAESASARVALTVSGGVSGTVLYIFRRDSAGVGVVRDTSAATIVWPVSGSLTVYDNEARQGEGTDYLLADPDGVQLASVHVTLPLWGTWLKSPGRPYLNTKCRYGTEAPINRAARRAVVDIEGVDEPVVLSEARAGKRGDISLLTLDAETAAKVDRLLDAGDTLMLDTDPTWAVPYRYISVGNATISRAYFPDMGLTLEPRIFAFTDVVAVAMPIGVTAVETGRTYDLLPTLYGSYAALAATVPTYEALAVGGA